MERRIHNLLELLKKVLLFNYTSVFHDDNFKSVRQEEEENGVYVYTRVDDYNYTKIGEWFNQKPPIFRVFQGLYYIAIVPLWVITRVCYALIWLFAPLRFHI